jgi:hypothetical protein
MALAAAPLAQGDPAAGAPPPRRRLALLVGVSDYPGLDADSQLQGPRNDVALWRGLLLERGFAAAAVKVLADGVADAALPTRAAIIAALDDLAGQAGPGDFVLLYFAGHGSQMPADPASDDGRAEADSLHEIFLPRDVGSWSGERGAVVNAIVDHEFNRRLEAMLARGAFVWAIFDACHAATLMRSVGDQGLLQRHVDPTALGVPAGRLAQALRGGAAAPLASTGVAPVTPSTGRVRLTTARGTGAAPAPPGGFVAFYAAQTHQTTPEFRLPQGHPERQPHGLFGFTLAEALVAADGASYRQLAQAVLQRYHAKNIVTPTPLFTGTALDSPLFGGRQGSLQRQWPLRVAGGVATIRAGLLDRLEPGAELAVLPGPLAPAGQALGLMRVERADAVAATLVPVTGPDRPALDPAALPKEAVARLVRPARPGFRVRVQAPPPGRGTLDAAVAAAISTLQREPPHGIEVEWVAPGQEHDLQLHVAPVDPTALDETHLWLVPPSAQWYPSGPSKTPSLRIGEPGLAQRLADSLQRVGRALNLLRIAATLEVVPDRHALVVRATLARAGQTLQDIDPTGCARLQEGDRVEVTMRNPARTAVDVTALYLDARFGITALYPWPAGSSNRIDAGGSDSFRLQIDVRTSGIERLLIIAVEARWLAERHDFAFLAQDRLPATRAGRADEVARMFEAAAFGPVAESTARGAAAQPTPQRLEMRVWSLQVG